MKQKRSEAECKLGEIMKNAIDHSTANLSLFTELKPAVIPPPETFMTDQGRYRKFWIVPVIGIAAAACSSLILAFSRIKKKYM